MMDAASKAAGFAAPIILTHGAIADLAAMTPEQVDFAHMANCLSKVARFNGRHAGASISVAQHCVMGADALFREASKTDDPALAAGYFLLHDAHEYLLGDIGRPSGVYFDLLAEHILLSRGVEAATAKGVVREAVDLAKRKLDLVIFTAAGMAPLHGHPCARVVAEMNERMCLAEARALYGAHMAIPLVRCDLPPPRLTQPLEPWGAAKAEFQFIDRLFRYVGISVRPA